MVRLPGRARKPGGKEIETEGFHRTVCRLWLQAQTQLPVDFHPHPKIKKLLETRQQMAMGEQPLDWAAAESLAFASLACAGFPDTAGGAGQ